MVFRSVLKNVRRTWNRYVIGGVRDALVGEDVSGEEGEYGSEKGEDDDEGRKGSRSSSATMTRSASLGPISRSEVAVELGLVPAEYVLELIKKHGGRVEQRQLVEATGWSAATVSRQLTEMEAAELVVRFPLGRGKVVCLPDSLPEWAVD